MIDVICRISSSPSLNSDKQLTSGFAAHSDTRIAGQDADLQSRHSIELMIVTSKRGMSNQLVLRNLYTRQENMHFQHTSMLKLLVQMLEDES